MIKGVKLMSVNELSSRPVTCMLGLLAWLKVRKFQNEIVVRIFNFQKKSNVLSIGYTETKN